MEYGMEGEERGKMMWGDGWTACETFVPGSFPPCLYLCLCRCLCLYLSFSLSCVSVSVFLSASPCLPVS